jgi:phosphoglycerate dehydrogenase-like enzyme
VKITLIDTMFLLPEHVSHLKTLGEFTYFDSIPEDSEEAKDRIRESDIVINFWFGMSKDIINSANNLKLICVASTGYDWINIEAARKRDIIVCNTPVYCEPVAEHTIGLMLNAVRLASGAERDIRVGKWMPEKYRGKELKNKTLGIIGYGAIGRRVAEIAIQAFEMRVLYVNSSSTRSEFEKLLKESDVVSIHVPIKEKTRGMVGNVEFNLMREGVVIINTGRGAIIDEKSLIKNLQTGKVFAVGLDTLSQEPMDNNNPLFTFPNVIITPHIAWNTKEADLRLSQGVVENIEAFIKGKPQNVIP